VLIAEIVLRLPNAPSPGTRVPFARNCACIEDRQRLQLPSDPYRGGWGVCTGSSCRKEKKKNKIKDFLFLSFFLSSFSLAVFDVLSCETAQCSRNDAVQGYVPAAIETTAVYQCKC